MTITERIKQLCDEKDTTFAAVERACDLSNGSIRRWEENKPAVDKLEKVSDYFNVSVDYLLGKTESKSVLSDKDKKDIAQEVDKLLRGIENENGLMFDGEIMDDETRQALRISLKMAVETARAAAKEKFTPKKYKK